MVGNVPWQCEEALKSHVFWHGRSGARRGAPAPKEASGPAVSLSAARQEHEERTGSKRHHGKSGKRVVGAAIKASALTVERRTCGALGKVGLEPWYMIQFNYDVVAAERSHD